MQYWKKPAEPKELLRHTPCRETAICCKRRPCPEISTVYRSSAVNRTALSCLSIFSVYYLFLSLSARNCKP